MSHPKINISVIVPSFENGTYLRDCLNALKKAAVPDTEIIVVDDASTDDTPAVAASMGVRVLRLMKNQGVACARNHGARHARGEILFFVDADVVVGSDAISRVRTLFNENLDVGAVFGSYDTQPRARGLVSQYRNLLHHYVHQKGNREASTFWAGCGAVRRSVFLKLGGFDQKRYSKPSIEDIELGYRLRGAGFRILLDKSLQATHLKRWTLRSLLKTDIGSRAIPWSRLILESQHLPNDLNLTGGQRLSTLLSGMASALVILSFYRIELLGLAFASLLGVFTLNRGLYVFFMRERGVLFTAGCIPLHFLYFLYSGASYGYVWSTIQLRGIQSRFLS